MKRLLLIAAIVGLAASLSGQSLTELAKREKARRASLKGRHAVVVRNADLLRVQKIPGVEVTPAYEAAAEDIAAETQGAEPAGLSGETESAASQPSGSGASAARRNVPRAGADGPLITGEADRDRADAGGTLEVQHQAAKDLVDLLTTKMNALRQQYEYQDGMVPGYVIQQQLDETNKRLLKAQAQQARIEGQLAKRGAAKKASGETER